MTREELYLRVDNTLICHKQFQSLESSRFIMCEIIRDCIEAVTPEKIDMLDVGELGGPGGRSGFSAIGVSSMGMHNFVINTIEANTKELLG